MASVQDIKRRVRSIKNTRKITKAMELVAAARLRRAQARIEAMRPYADRMLELMAGTARASTSLRGLPLLRTREVETVAIVPITGDRGLAGAFNAQVLRRAFALERSLRREGKTVRWLIVGRKGASTLRFRRYKVEQAWTGLGDRPGYHDAQAVAHRLAELYVEGEVDRVVVVYNAFVSPLVQRVTEQDVLPISEDVLEEGEEDARERALRGDFIYEPELEQGSRRRWRSSRGPRSGRSTSSRFAPVATGSRCGGGSAATGSRSRAASSSSSCSSCRS